VPRPSQSSRFYHPHILFAVTVTYTYNKPTRCTVFYFISLPRLYMFQAHF
jgi:hypothetical protein